MNKLKIVLIFVYFIQLQTLISQQNIFDEIQLIPSPQKIIWQSGSFEINKFTKIDSIKNAKISVDFLNDKLTKTLGFKLLFKNDSKDNSIEFILDPSLLQYEKEAYKLDVNPNKILISANCDVGFFYAVQTLLQLLPSEFTGNIKLNVNKVFIPSVTIIDFPKYEWRSFMLDSGRQFQSIDFIKRYLDYLAMMKINVFHWHLTEGQGWRIQIDQYPKLHEIGSRVAFGEEQQGYYSKEDIKEIVNYAAKRFITIVPEIDVPGHAEAALIAYPELSCTKKAPESVMGFSSNIFCGGNEETYIFMQNVLDEVCELFPGEYIHLGGDEAPKEHWDKCSFCQKKIIDEQLKNTNELQVYFSSRLANYLRLKSKKVILWGDVIEDSAFKLPENVIIYWWNFRKMQDLALQNARKIGNKVICGTNYYTYLNYPVTPWSKYNQDRTFDIRDIYECNPSNIKNPDSLIIGMGTSLWTDWNVTMEMIDKRVFPRVLVLADQMWGSEKEIPFEVYYKNIKKFYPRLKSLGIDYGPALRNEIPPNFSWD